MHLSFGGINGIRSFFMFFLEVIRVTLTLPSFPDQMAGATRGVKAARRMAREDFWGSMAAYVGGMRPRVVLGEQDDLN